jgi:hypothetical protein
MTLKEVARIRLPPHKHAGGFDHAAIDVGRAHLYLAHTANDSVEVVDLRTRRWEASIPALTGVAGVWVSQERELLFTSNRGEHTASIFRLSDLKELARPKTGHRPNGMAFDHGRQHLLVAGVGDRESGEPPTAAVIDVSDGKALHRFPLPGRTRWAVYHPVSDAFYVNIADPPCIVEIAGGTPSGIHRRLDIPAVGPHGLEQDPNGRFLYCACDEGKLVLVDLRSGTARVAGELAGVPDVAWLNARLHRLYVAVGDPGVVDVFRTNPLTHLESVPTGENAHTLTVDPPTDELHVFLPGTHEDLVFREGPAH